MGSQEMRDTWKAYAAYAAAAVSLAIIQNMVTQVATGFTDEQYKRQFERALQKSFPVPSVEFALALESDQKQKMPIQSLIEFTMNAKRVILRGPAGGGKSVIFGNLSKLLLGNNFVPIFLNLKNWRDEYSEELKRHETFEMKVQTLLKASIADLNIEMLNAFSSGLMKFIFVDGLNEVYGLGATREILDILDEYVRLNALGACVLVADRLAPRPYIGPSWEKVTLDYLNSSEVRRQIESKFGKRSYEDLPEIDRELLRTPYFLNQALASNSPFVGSRASAIRSFFTSQMGFDDSTLDSLARSAFSAYKNYRSSSFEAEQFRNEIGKDAWENLVHAGVIREQTNGIAQFDHQLKHDYLASRWLAKNEQLWQPVSFDAVSFESNSFESLSMTLEQLDSMRGDKFLKLVYDWNWLATVTCMENAARIHERPYTSDMEIAVLALVAEKVFDPILRTSSQATRVLAMFPEDTAARYFKVADSLEKVLSVVEKFDSKKEWFANWKTLFMRHQGLLSETEISMILEDDPILGWTASNVIRRFELDKGDMRQLRAYYDSSVKDAYKDSFAAATVRWRVVHALGKSDSEENVKLLLRALDQDAYLWVRYGAARSLVEIAARTKHDDRRGSIIEGLQNRVRSLPRIVLEEIGYAVFYRDAPDSWRHQVIPILENALEAQKVQSDQERWKKNIEDFKAWAKGEHPS